MRNINVGDVVSSKHKSSCVIFLVAQFVWFPVISFSAPIDNLGFLSIRKIKK